MIATGVLLSVETLIPTTKTLTTNRADTKLEGIITSSPNWGHNGLNMLSTIQHNKGPEIL